MSRYSFVEVFLIYFEEIPKCGEFVDCGSCAQEESCAWCASESVCITLSQAFSKDCRGLVFDPPCPSSYVPGFDRVLTFFNLL